MMKLIKFGFKENSWHLYPIEGFQPSNLIVGKNSAGKSKTLRSLFYTVFYIRNLVDMPWEFEPNMTFKDEDGNQISYTFRIEEGIIKYEQLMANERLIIERDEHHSIIGAETINPPANRLILQVRRDTDKYPDIEKIIQWCENSYYLTFNEIELHQGKTSPFSLNDDKYNIYTMLRTMTGSWRDSFKASAKLVGYDIFGIDAQPIANEEQMIITELGVPVPLLRLGMSKGMYRVLYLLVFMEYVKQHQYPTAIFIDDFCEGLDFERANRFGKMFFQFCEDNNIQLFVTSNDRFLMNVVDISKWTILYRENSKVLNVNSTSNPKIFEKFSFTGLNNFDLFSSDFIEKCLNKDE